jgi:hypothetical protein
VWFSAFWRPPFLLRSCILNLKSGEALSGVVWSTRAGWIALRKASLLKAGAPPMAIDGDVIVARDNIDFVQVLP